MILEWSYRARNAVSLPQNVKENSLFFHRFEWRQEKARAMGIAAGLLISILF